VQNRQSLSEPDWGLLVINGLSALYCLFAPTGVAVPRTVGFAIEIASIQVARLVCAGQQDFIVSVAG
jgi:hypothetical protein